MRRKVSGILLVKKIAINEAIYVSLSVYNTYDTCTVVGSILIRHRYQNSIRMLKHGVGISPLKSFQKSDSNTLVDQCLGGWVGEQQHHLVVSFSYVDTSNFIDNNNES